MEELNCPNLIYKICPEYERCSRDRWRAILRINQEQAQMLWQWNGRRAIRDWNHCGLLDSMAVPRIAYGHYCHGILDIIATIWAKVSIQYVSMLILQVIYTETTTGPGKEIRKNGSRNMLLTQCSTVHLRGLLCNHYGELECNG